MKLILFLICAVISFLLIGAITYFTLGYFLPTLDLIIFRIVLSFIIGYGFYRGISRISIFILLSLLSNLGQAQKTDKDIQQAVFNAEKVNLSVISLEGYYKIENPILITKSLRIEGNRLILDCSGSNINCVVIYPWLLENWNFTFSRVLVTPSIENSKAEITVKLDERKETTASKIPLFILKRD